ncbi:HNH endonuclease [Psychrobacter sp. Ps4]|uniref:HNH endonuclease n=1 Tax=Psychrobacter sp. Ps4 TaxID=2790958 RepID=UPI001EDE628E|nr:HNH endonuclease [Psychrobacter sp. Ps4]MCG3808923.1 HNH endonuclease [Psychrobacter sp. Ps4]
MGQKQMYCKYCAKQLAEKHRRKSGRIAKSRRRARIRNTKNDPIDPFDVFDAADWRCYLCGKSTPKSLRGTYDNRAPELDHIKPLSKGGTHTMDNVACCCRECNRIKSDDLL